MGNDSQNEKIRIGFDGKRAALNNTGLGNYSRFVIESLAKYNPERIHAVYTPRENEPDKLHIIRRLPNVEICLPDRRGIKSLWRSYGITAQLKRDGITLYHGLSNELPMNIGSSGIKSVVTIHDVIYRRLPYCYSAIDRKLYDTKYGHSCKAADRIIAVSECTKRDVMYYYGVDESKIDVVYQGCDAQFRRAVSSDETEGIKRKYSLPDRYVIQVGTIEKRKNLENTIRGMVQLPDDVNLVAVGRDRGYRKELDAIARELGLSGRIYYLDNAAFGDLPALYKGALASVYPSRYEGFGIPVLESLACGVPVVAATGSCLEEAGGEAAYYADPEDSRGIGEAMRAAIKKDTTRIETGRRHSMKFSNDNVARETEQVYDKILKRENFRL